MRTTAGYAVAALLSGVMLAGCGPQSGDGGASASGSDTGSDKEFEDGLLEFTQCMRDNGVDMPDPEGNGAVPALPAPQDGGSGPESKALRECEELLPVDENAPSEEELHERNLEMAQCLREEGLDIDDPKKGEGLGIPVEEGDEVTKMVQRCQEETGNEPDAVGEKAQ
ncbi:hypothetical protein [Allosalinactinospora lopnorensis]|uniref:hypothetical protein n=1 Tax=Allosalinactinospora lopnorensis TaxID=1352348 RepID=UPI000623C83E|nr:hypothetical protein [Allosalinactinospora lopnorensis]